MTLSPLTGGFSFVLFTYVQTLTTTAPAYTEAQQDANWDYLSPEQRSYFNGLAVEDPERTGQAFFEDTVPVELQDNPKHLEVYLNGGTVEVPTEVHDRGRAGSTYETREVEVSNKDWSHDTSRANGGSGSADNGRFEDASVNRSRGAANSTPGEQAAADAASDADVEVLTDSLSTADVQRAADLTLAAEGLEATSALATAGELALDFLAPTLGGLAAAKLAADQFESTEAKVAAGTGAGVATAALLCTPLGQAGLGCYLGYKLCRAGYRFFNKPATA